MPPSLAAAWRGQAQNTSLAFTCLPLAVGTQALDSPAGPSLLGAGTEADFGWFRVKALFGTLACLLGSAEKPVPEMNMKGWVPSSHQSWDGCKPDRIAYEVQRTVIEKEGRTVTCLGSDLISTTSGLCDHRRVSCFSSLSLGFLGSKRGGRAMVLTLAGHAHEAPCITPAAT